MSAPQLHDVRRRNVRLGLTLGAIAVGFFILIILKKVYIG